MAVALTHPLQQQLDQITATTRTLVQPERLARTDQVIADLCATGIEARTSAIGSQAPGFSLFAANGKLVRSDDLLALGPVVLKFFRGRWCPYDMTELEAWQALLPTFRNATRSRPALLVAISPQTQRHNTFTAENQAKPGGLTFPLLSDPGCNLAEQFGIAYTVPEPTRLWYRSMLVNIPLLHGDHAWRLPLPATVVLNQVGTILYAEAHADHRCRPDPQAVLDVLGTI
ncbi:MAG: peroxiredoxin-like family protein [Janthinobacterium lividum]